MRFVFVLGFLLDFILVSKEEGFHQGWAPNHVVVHYLFSKPTNSLPPLLALAAETLRRIRDTKLVFLLLWNISRHDRHVFEGLEIPVGIVNLKVVESVVIGQNRHVIEGFEGCTGRRRSNGQRSGRRSIRRAIIIIFAKIACCDLEILPAATDSVSTRRSGRMFVDGVMSTGGIGCRLVLFLVVVVLGNVLFNVFEKCFCVFNHNGSLFFLLFETFNLVKNLSGFWEQRHEPY
mmetsp:Transcript_19374/g.48246  ORF Transcript_19374/g.48246 Transcript_19374/m.48246 type:complete len:233 (+) Transcript_19374:327-1025(+)